MRISKLVLAVSLLGFVSACGVTNQVNENMDANMNSWSGATLDEAIEQWGLPTSQETILGKNYLHWDSTKTFTTPVRSNSNINVIGNQAYVTTYTYGGGTSDSTCRRTLQVNKKGDIESTYWSGGWSCPIFNSGESLNWPKQ